MLSLPRPTQAELQHSAAMCEYLTTYINRHGGMISFADYMQQVLYAPQLGYYVAGKIKFGEQGDFITAPEISEKFSMCVAKQTQQILATLSDANILEFGAGSGKMAADILLFLQQQKMLPRAYWILEPSAELQQLQQQTIRAVCPELLSCVSWLAELPQQKFKGVILANEVLDAMPVERFKIVENQAQQLNVDSKLTIQFQPIHNTRLQQALQSVPSDNLAEGYCSEVNLAIQPWLTSLAECLDVGLCLLIDYGYPRSDYYHPERSDGTLLCHYKHHAHADAFFYPGIQDITAHVDFTAVAEAAVHAGFHVSGYCHQAGFLLSCGIHEIAVELREIQQLVMPGQMGEIFKVMALTKNFNEALLGFSEFDLRGKL